MSPTTLPLAELLAPNLHVALIHFPLGMLVIGVLIELFAFLWRRSTVRTAARWLIGLGALSAIPAAFSGIYALRQVARVDMFVEGRSWADVRADSVVLRESTIWNAMVTHTLYQSVSTGLAVLAVVVWLGSGDLRRRTLHLPILGVLVLSVGGMIVGAWFSGEAIYKHGTGVDHGWPQTAANTEAYKPKVNTRVEDWFPPTELHVIAAGTTVALAMAAVGLSFRKAAVLAEGATLPVEPDRHGSADLARSFNPNLELGAIPKVFAGRAWVIAFLVAATTSLGGWYLLLKSASVLDTTNHQWAKVPDALWHQVAPERDHATGQLHIGRRLVHAANGGTIILVPLVLAGLARFAPRGRLMPAIFTGLLVGAVAAQVWLGVLLLYDGPEGPINHFNPARTPTETVSPPTSMPTTAPMTMAS